MSAVRPLDVYGLGLRRVETYLNGPGRLSGFVGNLTVPETIEKTHGEVPERAVHDQNTLAALFDGAFQQGSLLDKLHDEVGDLHEDVKAFQRVAGARQATNVVGQEHQVKLEFGPQRSKVSFLERAYVVPAVRFAEAVSYTHLRAHET